ncbi:MAG: tetratricopeptide repeat protein [Nitrospinae bacterium]|nr:tetratricopeptide repeat protein [Nitrospinota bacterium]
MGNLPAANPPHEVVGTAPAEGLVAAVLAGHPKGKGYDLVIAEDQIDALQADICWSRVLLERELEPAIPFVLFADRFDEKLKMEGVLPESVVLLELPFTFEHLTKSMELKFAAAIAREEAGRAAAIEWLMRAGAASDISTAIDDLYMSSARRLEKYLRYAPWSPLPHLALGKVYAGCNRHERAIPHLKAAIALDFSRQEAHRLLALCYRRTGQAFDELAELKEMLKADSVSSDLLLRIGEAALREGDYESAAAYFKEAIENFIPPGKPRRKAKMHVGLGKAHYMEGEDTGVQAKFGMAKTEFHTAMDTDPTLIAAYNNLVLAYRKLGLFAEAKRTMEQALHITPTEAEDWAGIFEIYLANGDMGKARYALQRAVKIDPENQRILCMAGEAYIRQGMFREAITQFEDALETNPSDVRLYNYLGICHRRLMELDAAVNYYLTALKIDPDDQNIHFNLGKAHLQNNQREKAAACFKKALAIDPSFKEAKKAAEQAERKDAFGDQRNTVR